MQNNHEKGIAQMHNLLREQAKLFSENVNKRSDIDNENENENEK